MACAPLAWLFAEGPRQAIFNVLHYNLLYRQREWGGAVAHNFGEWFAWVDSPQALILGLLAWQVCCSFGSAAVGGAPSAASFICAPGWRWL